MHSYTARLIFLCEAVIRVTRCLMHNKCLRCVAMHARSLLQLPVLMHMYLIARATASHTKEAVQKYNGVFPLSVMQATLLHCAIIKQKHVWLQGMTPLHLTAKGGKITVTEYLLTQSMPIDMQNNQVCLWHRQDTHLY